MTGRVLSARGRVLAGVWLGAGWLGIRVGGRYLKIRDVRTRPLRFSERNRLGYRQLLVVGDHWHVGVSSTRKRPPLVHRGCGCPS